MPTMIQLPIDLADVEVLSTESRSDGALIIRVESTLKSTRCRVCGQEIDRFHGHDKAIELHHLPILDREVYIRIEPKRYRCPNCKGGPTTTQRCEWYEPNSRRTKAYEHWVLRYLVNTTVSDTSRTLRLGQAEVASIVDRWVSPEVDWSRFVALRTIGIDEIALTRGHGNFVAVISTRDDAGRVSVLAVLPDRLKATVKGFLESIPEALKATVETVCTDMYDGYIHAAYEALPGVTVVIDRFHVAQKYREAVDELRKQELKRLREELSAEDYAPLKGLLWVFRQDWPALSEEQQSRLLPLFEHSPALQQACCLRWALTGIFNVAETRDRAEAALRAWCEQVRVSGLRCFDGFINTLNNRWKEITNYFLERQSSGFVEGLNNKLKVLKRRCYGLDNVRTLFQRLWLDLEGYRLFGAT